MKKLTFEGTAESFVNSSGTHVALSGESYITSSQETPQNVVTEVEDLIASFFQEEQLPSICRVKITVEVLE